MSEGNVTVEIQGQTYKGTLYRQNLQPSEESEPTVEDIQRILAENQGDLEITDRVDHIRVRTKEYLKDKDQWKKINTKIKYIGGKWIGAGKDSRWEIPK